MTQAILDEIKPDPPDGGPDMNTINSLHQRRYNDALKTLDLIEQGGHSARLAGGCVRDRLLGVQPMDFDIATSAEPELVLGLCKARGLRAIPTGIGHGTVTVLLPSGPIEVTTLRIDVATDGRRAQVRFGTSFEEDAARRDFTINAMFEDKDGRIYDWHGGHADLRARKLVFVGDASSRIREDYLRILRLFRFMSQLRFSVDPITLDAVRTNLGGLAQVSQERITSELLKTLAGGDVVPALTAMHQTGVLAAILPEIAGTSLVISDLAKVVIFDGGMPPVAKLAVLLLLAGLASEASWQPLAARLRLANRDGECLDLVRHAIAVMPRLGTEIADVLEFLNDCEKKGGADAHQQIVYPALQGYCMGLSLSAHETIPQALARVRAVEDSYGFRRAAALLLNGREISARYSNAVGPNLGHVLRQLKRAQLNGVVQNKEDAWALVANCMRALAPAANGDV